MREDVRVTLMRRERGLPARNSGKLIQALSVPSVGEKISTQTKSEAHRIHEKEKFPSTMLKLVRRSREELLDRKIFRSAGLNREQITRPKSNQA